MNRNQSMRAKSVERRKFNKVFLHFWAKFFDGFFKKEGAQELVQLAFDLILLKEAGQFQNLKS